MAPDANQPDFQQYVLVIGLYDRPGAVHSVAEVFSGRGLQMEAFFGIAGSMAADANARALILFDATAERADLVARVLRRLSVVRSAELIGAEDPRLVQSFVIAPPEGAEPEGIALSALGKGMWLAAGTPTAVRRWVASTTPPKRLGAMQIEWVGGR